MVRETSIITLIKLVCLFQMLFWKVYFTHTHQLLRVIPHSVGHTWIEADENISPTLMLHLAST